MATTQTAVLSRIELETRAAIALPPPPEPPPPPPRRSPRPADRIRDAILQWLEEEA